jgi:hypothetical protein
MIFFISKSLSLRGHSRRGWFEFRKITPLDGSYDLGQLEECRGRGNCKASINHPLAKKHCASGNADYTVFDSPHALMDAGKK